MTKKKISKKRFVAGLVVGAALSGTAALLFAPRSGKETRDKYTKEVTDTLDLIQQMKQSSQDIATHSSHIQELMTTLVPEVLEETEKSVEAFKFKSKYRIEALKDQLTKIETDINAFKQES